MTANYYKPGDNNVICDVCGAKVKASNTRRRWDRLVVCQDDWEPRHPQDFVRGRRDRQVPAVIRPEPTDNFLDANDVTADDL